MTPLIAHPAVFRRDLAVIAVTGEDRTAYLHALLSQDVAGARVGSAADFLLLDHKGSPLAAGRLLVTAGAVLLLAPTSVVDPLVEMLRGRTFLMDATTEVLAWAVASVRGPGEVGVPGARSDAMTAAPHGDGFVVRDRSGGVDVVGPVAWVDERVEGLGLPVAETADWERWRVAHGEPAWGAEIAEGRRAQELGLLPTHVHLRKGCYPGQESIAKIHNLGRPKRALALVESEAPLAVSGAMTSVAQLDGRSVGLAFVSAGSSAGDRLEVDGVPVVVTRLIGAGLPQPGA